MVVVLLIHYQAASGLEILLQQRTPGCNPVVENTDVTLKVVQLKIGSGQYPVNPKKCTRSHPTTLVGGH